MRVATDRDRLRSLEVSGDVEDGQYMARRMAFWAAIGCALFSGSYVALQLFEWLGLLGSAGGPESPSSATGLALLLTPSLLLGPAFLILMAALHQIAPTERRAFSQAALGFATVYATLVSMVYFTQLTLVAPRMIAHDVAGIEPFLFVPYRTFLFAVDLLGYSMMSLATLFSAFALPAGPKAHRTRAAMIANGLILPFLALQMYWPVLIWGGALWGITFPAAMVLLALLMGDRRTAK
jgi:hypothetical protein